MQNVFTDLDPRAFPFTIQWFSKATGELKHKAVVTGPGALFVPPMGERTDVRIEFADGEVQDSREPK